VTKSEAAVCCNEMADGKVKVKSVIEEGESDQEVEDIKADNGLGVVFGRLR
jgi:hypothetical protein